MTQMNFYLKSFFLLLLIVLSNANTVLAQRTRGCEGTARPCITNAGNDSNKDCDDLISKYDAFAYNIQYQEVDYVSAKLLNPNGLGCIDLRTKVFNNRNDIGIKLFVPNFCANSIRGSSLRVRITVSTLDGNLYTQILTYEKCLEGRSSSGLYYQPLKARPNPFNNYFDFSFELQENARVNINLYNNLGQKMTTLTSETYTAGEHTVTFENMNLPKGYYFIRYHDSTGNTKTIKVMKL